MDDADYRPELDPDHEHAGGWRAFSTLGLFLEEDEWHPQRVADRQAYTTTYQGTNGSLMCSAVIRVEAQHLVIYAYAPVKAPEASRVAVAEFIARANYGMYIGNFELDMSDGEVRYKTSLNFEGEDLTMGLIRNHIYPAVSLMDRYLPGVMRVVYGGATPAEAITEIEGA